MVGYQSQFCCFQSISFIEAIEGVYIVVPMDNSEKIGENKRENKGKILEMIKTRMKVRTQAKT